MSSSRVVKSPTSVGLVPTFELEPFVLILTCRRSGNDGTSTVLVQKVSELPSCRVTGGVNNQLLIVLLPVVFWKLAAIYDVGAPDCDGNTVSLPWNQSVDPPGTLLLS